jgi:hypothetical protein
VIWVEERKSRSVRLPHPTAVDATAAAAASPSGAKRDRDKKDGLIPANANPGFADVEPRSGHPLMDANATERA